MHASTLRLLTTLACAAATSVCALGAAPAISTFGERNAAAPPEIETFAFLVGKWNGTGVALGAEGREVPVTVTWIGRFALDGFAITDEFHSTAPDGKPYLGISFRQFVPQRGWVVEYLNVSGSFIRRQVHPGAGSIQREPGKVTVISEDGNLRIREFYEHVRADQFTYATDLSRDSGKTWEPVSLRLTMTRAP